MMKKHIQNKTILWHFAKFSQNRSTQKRQWEIRFQAPKKPKDGRTYTANSGDSVYSTLNTRMVPANRFLSTAALGYWKRETFDLRKVNKKLKGQKSTTNTHRHRCNKIFDPRDILDILHTQKNPLFRALFRIWWALFQMSCVEGNCQPASLSVPSPLCICDKEKTTMWAPLMRGASDP